VGVNKYQIDEDSDIDVLKVSSAVRDEQIALLKQIRASRDEAAVQKALADLEKAVKVNPAGWRYWHHLISYCNELGMFDLDSPADVIMNEIFADFNATYATGAMARVNRKVLLNYRQSADLLARLYAKGSEETAEIIIRAIIKKQDSKLIK